MKDYIERAELYEAMNSQDCEFSLIDALVLIEEFSAADVAPVRHGRWIWNSHHCKWECSECGGMEGECESPVCKWCGARMDKEDEHEAG